MKTVPYVQTTFGAMLSLMSMLVIFALLFIETDRFLHPEVREHMVVDTSPPHRINIELNVSFLAIPCPDIRIDLMDVTGEQQVSINRKVFKQRMDMEQRPIGRPYLDKPDVDDYRVVPGLGVMRVGGKQAATVKLSNEGCNVAGVLEVNKAAGNFHIAIGKGLKYGSQHIHHFSPEDMHYFNTSHTIHHLRFGSPFPGFVDPLQGTQQLLVDDKNTGDVSEDKTKSEVTAHYDYFIQLVPTKYRNRFGQESISSQYSVLSKTTTIDLRQPQRMSLPGVFFIYKFSPFMLLVSEEPEPFFHFVTSLCAIVGGIITVSGIIDAVVFHYGLTRKRMFHRRSDPLLS